MNGRGLMGPESALALALAGTRERREASRRTIGELTARTDFRILEELLRVQGMLSLIGQRLLELTDRAPEDFAERVRDYDRQAQHQGIEHQLITIRLVAALADAGIRSLPLKGPMLGERLHGTPGARVSADIDLLVASESLDAATAVLASVGYARAPSARGPEQSKPDLHRSLRCRDVCLPEVELHWRVHWYEESFSTAMLERAHPGPDGCLRPSAPDELIALLLFYARDGMAGLRLLADLTAWWDRYGGTPVGSEVDVLAREHPSIASAVATAALTAMQLGGFPATVLFEPEVLSHASRFAMRLSNWSLRGKKSQVSANIAIVDCLLTPSSQRRALLRRQFWRDDVSLRGEWPQVTLTRLALIRMRVLHLLRLSARCVAALWQLRRGYRLTPVPDVVDAGGIDER